MSEKATFFLFFPRESDVLSVVGVSLLQPAEDFLEGGVGGGLDGGEAEAGPEGLGGGVAEDVVEVDLLGSMLPEVGAGASDEGGGGPPAPVGGVDVD